MDVANIKNIAYHWFRKQGQIVEYKSRGTVFDFVADFRIELPQLLAFEEGDRHLQRLVLSQSDLCS